MSKNGAVGYFRVSTAEQANQNNSLPTQEAKFNNFCMNNADGRSFHNGRQFAAWIGLVPRQYSNGDKQRHFGITKRGDPYLRMLLVHGARSVVYRAPTKQDSRSQWIAEKQRKLGTAKTCVAVANKNARVIWALLARDETYRRAV